MAFSVLRYYYFLEDDQEIIEQLTAFWKKEGIPADSGGRWPFFKEAADQRFSRLQYGNIVIMILGLKETQGSWDAYISSMEEWEEQARVADNDLLAKVTVLCGSDSGWEELLVPARGICPYRDIVSFSIQKGQLARLDWKWPRGRAYYLFQQDEVSPSLERFFSSSLPLLEAGLIRLNMVSNLYRDRNTTILKEINGCDSRLSNILHTQLVSEQAAGKRVGELEEQVQELSSSYGILAGDYSMIQEGVSRLNGLMDAVMIQIKGERFFKLANDVQDAIFSPYNRRLTELKNTIDDLRASRENHQAAIDVVRSRIDIMLSRENIETQERIKHLMEINTSIQQQSLTFQIAAGIIEFIVLAYYSHSLWKNLAHGAYDLVPPGVQLIMVVLFSWTTVYCTHLIAEYRQGDTHIRSKMLLYCGLLCLLLGIVIFGTYWLQMKAAH
ncbi:MAG TPA: hypothetical protein VN426_03760 [Syntrophomonadaceae bacterium]|nr:hypothetical protein [Syntrophomonadaceae bacterium]